MLDFPTRTIQTQSAPENAGTKHLPPTVIADLIRAEITGLIDQITWDEAAADEERNRDLLGRAAAVRARARGGLHRASRRATALAEALRHIERAATALRPLAGIGEI
jgi:hypothetical protein